MLAFISEEKGWRVGHFATNFIKTGGAVSYGYGHLYIQNVCQWWPPFCNSYHVTKSKNTNLQHFGSILHLKTVEVHYIV